MRLIDADALAEVLGIKPECADCENAQGAFCTKGSDFVNACEAIFDAPTIDTVKHGKWRDFTCMNWHGWHCSVCDYETQRKTRFCPECGARMDGGSIDDKVAELPLEAYYNKEWRRDE